MRKTLKSLFLITLSLICGILFTACSGSGKKSFKVNYMVDGETYLTQTVKDGNLAEVPESPEKDGYAGPRNAHMDD